MQIYKAKNSGFTLIELLLSIGILVVIFTMATSSLLKKQRSMEFEITNDALAQTLFEARENSRNFKKDFIYGVNLSNDKYELFQGTSTGVLVTTDLPWFIEINSIALNGWGSEILFDKNSGTTNNYGSFKVTSNDGEIMIFEINKHGLINFNYVN